MAIYHCSCKVMSRAKGYSAVASAAYRSADKLKNEYDGLEHDYSRKDGVVHSEIMLPQNAPERYMDRATLWNEVERVEKGRRAQLAREYEMALPREVTREEQIKFVRKFVKENFVDKGMCADWSIHDKGDGNPHVHIMLTMRSIKENGEWAPKEIKDYARDENGERIPIIDEKTGLQKVDSRNRKQWKREYVQTNTWNSKALLQETRAAWAAAVNHELERKGLPDRIDHRTLKDQGIDRIPTIHEGKAQKKMKERIAEGKMKPIEWEYDKEEINREIKQTNVQAAAIEKEISEVDCSIGSVKEDIAWNAIHSELYHIREDVVAESWSEAVQLEGLKRLDKLAVVTAETRNAQDGSIYHAGAIIEKMPYLDYQSKKAMEEQAIVRAKIGHSLNFIRTAYPHYDKYQYGKVTPLDINERMRTDRDEDGLLRVVQRSPMERSVILDAKRAHMELCEVYDTTQLRNLIAQQAEAQRMKRPTRNRDEELVRQIRESFENLRFMEQKQVFSIVQAQATVKSLGEQYNVCQGQITEAERLVAKLEATVKLPQELAELKKRVEQNNDNPEYMKTQCQYDIMQMKSCMDKMKEANITDAASLKKAMATIKQYKERIGELKGAITGISAELEGYKRFIATINRIDREKGRPRPALSGPIQEPAQKTSSNGQTAAAGKVAEHPKQPAKGSPRVDLPHEKFNFDIYKTAMQLIQYRSDFIRESIKAQYPSYYMPNVVYRQQSQHITDCVRNIQDYKESLDKLTKERRNMGLFQGKQKRDIGDRIKNLKQRLSDEERKLKPIAKEMGFDVKDLNKAKNAANELRIKADREDAMAKAALANVGASERANVAKMEYIALAKAVPKEEAYAVIEEIKRCKPTEMIGITKAEIFQGEKLAKQQLDVVLTAKCEQSEQGVENQRQNDKSNDRFLNMDNWKSEIAKLKEQDASLHSNQDASLHSNQDDRNTNHQKLRRDREYGE